MQDMLAELAAAAAERIAAPPALSRSSAEDGEVFAEPAPPVLLARSHAEDAELAGFLLSSN